MGKVRSGNGRINIGGEEVIFFRDRLFRGLIFKQTSFTRQILTDEFTKPRLKKVGGASLNPPLRYSPFCSIPGPRHIGEAKEIGVTNVFTR